MKHLPILALILALASCAPAIPRAILPPPSEVEELDVEPVTKASTAAREAVREIAAAGNSSREASRALADTSVQLRAAIDRADMLARAKGHAENAFAEIQLFALQLSADVDRLTAALKLAEDKEAIALDTIDALTSEVSTLEADAAAQAAQIRIAHANEELLRKQVNALSESADKRVIAQDKLSWWRSAALWTWAIILALALIGALLRRAGRFPF
jgi:hypothetical protein